MSAPTKVLFYDDAAEFGGHEVMTVAAVRYLAASGRFDLGFMYYAGNARLGARLEEIARGTGRLELLPLEQASRTLQAFRSLVSFRRVRALAARMGAFRPALVVIAQGRIEACTLGLLAARRAGLRLISYLPLAHRAAVAGNPLLGPVKDLVNALYYRLPDRYVTVAGAMARELRARGVQVPIAVVENGIEPVPELDQGAPGAAIPPSRGRGEVRLGVVGRIDFTQKGQDLLIRALAKQGHRLGPYRLSVIGEGPDRARLAAVAERLGIGPALRFVPWLADLEAIYRELDVLVIPSRFEGMPLVLLEALARGVPVAASRRDGMAEILPAECLFDPHRPDEVVDGIQAALDARNSLGHRQRVARVRERNTLAAFGAEFARALEAAVAPGAGSTPPMRSAAVGAPSHSGDRGSHAGLP